MTIGKKLDVGIGVLLALFLLLGAVSYFETKQIDESLREIAEVEEPISAAVYEMQIHANCTGMGVLKYLYTGDTRYREQVEKNKADFEKFHIKYLQLANAQKRKELGNQVGLVYQELETLGQTLMSEKDNQDVLFAMVAENFEKINKIIDEEIQPKIDLKGPDGLENVLEASRLKANIAEVGTWLGTHLRTPKEQHRKRIFDNADDFEQELTSFKNLRLTEDEKYSVTKLESVFSQTISLIKKILILNDYLQENTSKFSDMEAEIDDLLYDHTYLEHAKEMAHKTVGIAAIVTLILVFAGFIIGFVSYATITRSITKRITTLRDATSIIGKGELDTQIEIEPNDEIGELAASFNDMAHKLKESYTHLEKRVQGRTAELTAANKQLTIEVAKRKEAKAQLQTTQENLIGAARRAGMAEVATGMLHNVGNVLNSASVTTESIQKKVRNSKVPYLTDVVNLLEENADNLGELMTNDERGKKLPAFLANLSKELIEEQGRSLEALQTLITHIEHTANIIQLQQLYSKTKGLTEPVSIVELVEDTIRINSDALTQHSVDVKHELVDLPPVLLDRHKVLQILTNLINNAKKALSQSGRDEKILTIRVKEPEGGYFRIEVSDNGIGIVEENLTQIFEYKFTTSEDGHGFGLHSAALAANEMNGSLSAHSDGPGKGAVFTLELPFKTQETQNE